MTRAAGADGLMRALREWAEGRATSSAPAPSAAPQHDPERPRRVGEAPAVFSTRTTLAVPWRFSWDANGWYRALGVHWGCGRRELWLAYLAAGGQDSEYLTYVLGQLLDPGTRRQYDAVPPGRRLYDRYQAEEDARQFAARMALTVLDHGGDEAAALASAVEEGWAEPSGAPVDPGAHGCDDRGAPPQHETPPPQQFSWGHYLWRSQGVSDSALAEWQRLVVSAAAERGIEADIAVGACGGSPHRAVVALVGRVVVAYLSEDHEPTEEVAALAADALRHAVTTR